MTASEGLIEIGAAIVLGVLLAAAVAVGISPLAPSVRCARSTRHPGSQPTGPFSGSAFRP